jgi:hypothetical protein
MERVVYVMDDSSGVGEQFVDILPRSILVHEVPKCSYISERGIERFVTPPYAAS